MKKLALLIGLFAFLVFIGTARATTYNCTSCSDCNTKINTDSTDGDIIQMISNITAESGASPNGCIHFDGAGGGGGGSDNKTFDCLGNTIIEGGGGGHVFGIAFRDQTFNDTVRNCVITGFTISDAAGIYFDGSVWVLSHKVINSTISGNYYGILLSLTNSSTVINSHIENNSQYGIFDFGGNNYNNIFYNNMINNTNNYFNSSGSSNLNFWNTTITNSTNIIGGSQIGGNYWAYPNGTGYSQTCDNADNDSFCDAPFVLNENNTDYLPLTTNWTMEAPVLNITWNTPANNSFTLNLSSILWNATISDTPNTCILNINGTANYSMLISGNDCYYTTSNLTNQTTYCGIIYANNSISNLSNMRCATINLTSAAPTPPTPTPPIDNLGLFGGIALLVMGAGVLLFLLEGIFGSGALLRNPKGIMLVIIGAIIMIAMILALL